MAPLFRVIPPATSKLNFQDWMDKGYQSNSMKLDSTQCPICGSSGTTCKGENDGSTQARTEPPAAEPVDAAAAAPDPGGVGNSS